MAAAVNGAPAAQKHGLTPEIKKDEESMEQGEEDGEPPMKKSAKNPSMPKTPFGQLCEHVHECNNILQWTESTRNKTPWFICHLELDGLIHSGEGRSKKDAKNALAEIMLPLLPPTPERGARLGKGKFRSPRSRGPEGYGMMGDGYGMGGPMMEVGGAWKKPKQEDPVSDGSSDGYMNPFVIGGPTMGPIGGPMGMYGGMGMGAPNMMGPYGPRRGMGPFGPRGGWGMAGPMRMRMGMGMGMGPRPQFAAPPGMYGQGPFGMMGGPRGPPKPQNSPLSVLHRMLQPRGADWKPTYVIEEISEGPNPTPSTRSYKCVLTIKDKTYEVICGIKKECKYEVAKKALKDLFQYDTSEFETSFVDQHYGKDIFHALSDICVKKAWKIESSILEGESLTVPLDQSEVDKNRYQCKLSFGDGSSVIGEVRHSKREAKTWATRKALAEKFDVSEEDIQKVEMSKKVQEMSLPALETKSPLSLLHEMCMAKGSVKTSPVYELVETIVSDPDAPRKFTHYKFKLTIGEKEFEGIGPGKKIARQIAAKAALKDLFQVEIPDSMARGRAGGGGQMMMFPGMGHGMMGGMSAPRVPAIADHVAELVRKKIKEVSDADGLQPGREYAGFVVTTGVSLEDAYVVSIGTGTKCIGGGNISQEGLAINDCHAEVMARRGLMMFLYRQLAALKDSYMANANSIFEYRTNNEGFKLKDTVKLHLYITSAPCGDARLFSPMDGPRKADHTDPHRSRKNRGLLRVKIESGMGTIPVTSNNVTPTQTWDAIMGGERLLCMSCSDKILRWNVLGLQGALLSQFTEPIYVDTIVLGSLFHQEHMIRSCYARLGHHLEISEPMYWLNQPMVSGVSEPQSRSTTKPPEVSCNWMAVADQSMMEVLTQDTGKGVTGIPSRVCKRKMFDEYLGLFGKIPAIENQPSEIPKTYAAAKKISTMYGKMKESFFKALEDAGHGKWARKPQEMDDFGA